MPTYAVDYLSCRGSGEPVCIEVRKHNPQVALRGSGVDDLTTMTEIPSIETIAARLVKNAPCLPGFYPVVAVGEGHNVTVYRSSAKAAREWIRKRARTGRYEYFAIQAYDYQLDLYGPDAKLIESFNARGKYAGRLQKIWESKLPVDRAKFDPLVRQIEGAGYARTAHFDGHYYSSAIESSNMLVTIERLLQADRQETNQNHIVLYSEPDLRGMTFRLFVDWMAICPKGLDQYLDDYSTIVAGDPLDLEHWTSILHEFVITERAPVFTRALREMIQKSSAGHRWKEVLEMWSKQPVMARKSFWAKVLISGPELIEAGDRFVPETLAFDEVDVERILAPYIGTGSELT